LWSLELEILKGLRSKRLWAVLLLIAFIYVPVFYLLKGTGLDAMGVLLSFTSKTALFFLGIVAITIGAQAINGEIKDGTIGVVLSKSVTRPGYLLGKFLGNVVVFVIALALTILVTLTGLRLVGAEGSVQDVILLNVLLLLVLSAFLALGYVLSTVIRSPSAALGVALIVFFLIYTVLPSVVTYMAIKNTGDYDVGLKDDYYTKYLFFAPNAQFDVILDRVSVYKPVNRTVETPEGEMVVQTVGIEYRGVIEAIKDSYVNVALLVGLTIVYFGIATWRFTRMDLR